MLRRLIFIALLSVSAPVMADSIDVNLNNNVAQFQYIAPVGYSDGGKAEVHAGFLYDNDDNVLGDLGILVMNDVGNKSGTTLGVGVKGMATLRGNSSMVLALGGQARFTPFIDRRIGIAASVYAAPKIVAFGGADFFVQTGLNLEYEIMKQAVAYVGYRTIKFGVENGPDVINEKSANLGIRISF